MEIIRYKHIVEVPGGRRATGRCDHKSADRGDGEAVCTAYGWRCQEDGGQWAREIARGSLGDGQA